MTEQSKAPNANPTADTSANPATEAVKTETAQTTGTRAAASTPVVEQPPGEIGGPRGPEPTRYGDWEAKGRCSDF